MAKKTETKEDKPEYGSWRVLVVENGYHKKRAQVQRYMSEPFALYANWTTRVELDDVALAKQVLDSIRRVEADTTYRDGEVIE